MKLVEHIKMDIPGFPKQELYCYGEASFEANQAMQEPLEKLYKYENQPDMKEKIRVYISELEEEISRCGKLYEDVSVSYSNPTKSLAIQCRIETLWQVKGDLESRLEEFDMNRTEIVMKALDVEKEDAEKIVEHLTKHDCLEWIDDYNEENRSNEPLTDVHYENDFEDMINWQYDDAKPSEMLGMSNNIKDYPEMLELEDNVIFWYGLV